MTELTQTQTDTQNRPPDFTALSALLKNLIFILGAAVSFSLWLSSTITTPKRIDKLEEALSALSAKQNAMEAQTTLIYGDLKEIKTLLITEKQK
jgi:outer membrane murein-binding lipoprotein Lpp